MADSLSNEQGQKVPTTMKQSVQSDGNLGHQVKLSFGAQKMSEKQPDSKEKQTEHNQSLISEDYKKAVMHKKRQEKLNNSRDMVSSDILEIKCLLKGFEDNMSKIERNNT